MRSYFELTRGATSPLEPVKSFEQVALEKPPKIRFPDREYTYIERLPENSVFQNAATNLEGLGLFDDLEEQDARMEQHHAQQMMRRRVGGLGQQRQEPPDLAWLHQQAGDLARTAAARAAEELAQHVVRAAQREAQLQAVAAQVSAQGHVPIPQFLGQGGPPRQRTRAAVSSAMQTEAREHGQDAPTQTEDAAAFRRETTSQTEDVRRANFGTQTARPPLRLSLASQTEEAPRASFGTQTDEWPVPPPFTGRGHVLEPMYGPMRERRGTAYGTRPEDRIRTAAIQNLGHFTPAMVPNVTVGHNDLAIAGAPLTPHVPQVTQFFSIADGDAGDDVGDDIVDDNDDLARAGRGTVRPSEGAPANEARRQRREPGTQLAVFDPARGAQLAAFDPTRSTPQTARAGPREPGNQLAIFDPLRGAQLAVFDPTALTPHQGPPAPRGRDAGRRRRQTEETRGRGRQTEETRGRGRERQRREAEPSRSRRREESMSTAELERQRRRRLREHRRDLRRDRITPEEYLERRIADTRAEEQVDERRAARRRVQGQTRRQGGFPPTY
jgi:hypothetical protein